MYIVLRPQGSEGVACGVYEGCNWCVICASMRGRGGCWLGNHHRTQLPATRPVGRWRGAGALACLPPSPLPPPPWEGKDHGGKGRGGGFGFGELGARGGSPPSPSLSPRPPQKLPMRPYYAHCARTKGAPGAPLAHAERQKGVVEC